MANQKCLIVGANSFLAAQLATTLFSDRNISITGLIHRSDNRVDYTKYKNVYKELDVLYSAMPYFDVIYLTGAFLPAGNTDIPDRRFVTDNVELVCKISSLYPTSRIVFTSSISVYGLPVALPLTENAPFNNPSLYGMSKLAGEAIVRNHASYAIIRFSSIWGPGMESRTFIPRVIEQAKTGEIVLWGSGKRLQNYIHVKDAAMMCILAASATENLILLGVHPKSYSNTAVAEIVASKLPSKISYLNEDHSADALYDADLSYQKINYFPGIEITEGIGELL